MRIAELDAEIDAARSAGSALVAVHRSGRRALQPLRRRSRVPRAKAVMFCLMDVSGSMGEREKDLAKRFFMLLHLFLKRRYERVDIVFIRHTHEAQEVDEQDFFYGRADAAARSSRRARRDDRSIATERYPAADWNIYAPRPPTATTQASDSRDCVALLTEAIMPLCQYYAYIEIIDERETECSRDRERHLLWRAYRRAQGERAEFRDDAHRQAAPTSIPVFRELFAKQPRQEAAT